MESKNSLAVLISEEFGQVLSIMSFERRLGGEIDVKSRRMHSIKVSLARLTNSLQAWKLL